MKKLIVLVVLIVVLGVGAVIGYPHYQAYTYKDEPTNINEESTNIVFVPEGEKLMSLLRSVEHGNVCMSLYLRGKMTMPFAEVAATIPWRLAVTA